MSDSPPPPSDPRVTRRMVLGVTGLLTAAAAGGAMLRVASWWDPEPGSSYRCLADHEAALLDAMAEAYFPPGGTPAISGREAGVARFLDDLFSVMDEPTPSLLRTLLHAIDDWSRLVRGGGFVTLSIAERGDALRSWSGSGNHLVRGAIGGLGTFIATAYCGHPAVKAACGWQFPCGYER